MNWMNSEDMFLLSSCRKNRTGSHTLQRNRVFFALVFHVCMCMVIQLSGQDHVNDTLIVTKCLDFEIDGLGTHHNWNETAWINLLQRDSLGNRYQTQVKIRYSESGLYFLFHCEDSIITSTLKEDFADLWNEDVVEIFLWTSGEHSIYFEYELSPANYELPILVPNMEGVFLGWRPWHYEGDRRTRHKTGIVKKNTRIQSWMAEIYIPYALLKPLLNIPPEKGTTWRINLYRNDYDRGLSSWSWKAIVKSYHEYEKFGVLLFQ